MAMSNLEQAIYDALKEGSIGGSWIDRYPDGKRIACRIDGTFDLSKVAEALSNRFPLPASTSGSMCQGLSPLTRRR